ncbi:MAG: ABC transporter substrate-binding protein [Alphaproteobacteria bacterium]|nr:ABC transporter substrate-binding protein [Alphaproteobacteria bacterium]
MSLCLFALTISAAYANDISDALRDEIDSELAAEFGLSHKHGLAIYGEPQLAAGFTHYPASSLEAQSGGTLRMARLGSFDSLNPFSVRGKAALGIRERVFESLLDRHYGESFTSYGLLAQSVEVADDFSWVRFYINPAARFSDGAPVTTADVAFSWNLLKGEGRPNHRFYYSKVAHIESDDSSILFTFTAPDRELPLIIGLMPILPQHIYDIRNIKAASLDTPIGSGAYVIEGFDTGRRIMYRRNPDYWGLNLNVNRGRHNFTHISEDYYRDDATAFEAFKTGAADVWFEHNPLRWRNGYDFPAAKDKRITRQTIALGIPSGLRAFVMNTRHEPLSHLALRQALDLMFDFEWVNKTFYDNAYSRTQSYFGNTELSAFNRPASDAERVLLQDSTIDRVILRTGYRAPVSNGSGRDRLLRRQATALLENAGFQIRDQQLYDPNGEAVRLRLLVNRRPHERIALAWARMVKQIGVDLQIRLVDDSQYQRHLQNFDYDIILYDYYASLSPGNEQAFYWGAEAATTQGSRNYAGIQDAGLDNAIAALTQAQDKQGFTTAARAIDRALMGGHYFVPLFHTPTQWIAQWQHLQHPLETSLYGTRLDTWWISLKE